MSRLRNKNILSKNKSVLIQLSKTRNPLLAISNFKKTPNKEVIEKNFHLLSNHMLYKSFIKGICFPQTYMEIEFDNPLFKGNLDQELWWSLLTICEYTTEINEFIIESEKYSDLLFYGLYDKATNKLNEIENKFGLSNWLIENRIILLSKKSGLKEQKEYLAHIRKELPSNTALLTYYFSQKLESELSFEQFTKNFKEHWKAFPNIKNYYLIKCNPLVETIDNLVDYIHQESISSIIDRYITLKKTLYIVFSNSNKYGLPELSLKKYLNKLKYKIKDDELKPLFYNMSILSMDQFKMQAEDYVIALDLYTSGKYKLAYELCLKLLSLQFRNWINILELLIKCELRYSDNDLPDINIVEKSIVFKVYQCFKSILRKDSFLISSTNNLYKIALEFSSYYISNQIVLFINKNIPFFITSSSKSSLKIAKLNTILYDIRNRVILDKEQQMDLLKTYIHNYPNSITYQLLLPEKDDLLIPTNRKNKYKILDGDPNLLVDQKISIYTKILKNGDILDKYEAILLLSKLLFDERKIKECLKCIIDGYLFNKNLIYSIPIKEITEYIAKYHKFDFLDNICMPILFDLYSKNISSQFDSQRNMLYDMFMEMNNVLKPSELIKICDKFDIKKINYFFQFNCTMKVLESSPNIDTMSEVESERINLCRFLVNKNSELKPILLQEIKNITEESLISKLIIEIEEKKIYVNTEGLLSKIFAELNEFCLRYNSLSKTVTHLRLKLIRIYVANSKYPEKEEYPDNDIMPLLYNALTTMKDYFVTNGEYGLAGFLSTNIRHGKLYNFLTSSLLSSHLIIKSKNNFWEEQYKDSDPKHVEELVNYIRDFTNKFDTTINNFINKYIQIKSNEKDKKDALFAYDYQKDIVVPLYQNLGEDVTLDDFQKYLLEILWVTTENNLVKIRNKISMELSPYCQELIIELRENLETLEDNLDLTYIYKIISNESIDLQRKIDKVILWFSRQNTSNIENFNFKLPINIVREVIDNVHVNNQLSIHTDINENLVIKGFYLKGFVDILFILFDNSINSFKKEINLSLDKELYLKFEVSNVMNYDYKLTSSNRISGNTNIELLEQKLDAIRDNISLKMYGKSVVTEGGTGFYKTTKILKYDMSLASNYDLNFYIDKNTYKFIVEINFKENECLNV